LLARRLVRLSQLWIGGRFHAQRLTVPTDHGLQIAGGQTEVMQPRVDDDLSVHVSSPWVRIGETDLSPKMSSSKQDGFSGVSMKKLTMDQKSISDPVALRGEMRKALAAISGKWKRGILWLLNQRASANRDKQYRTSHNIC
jgi:hypothetical protein